ncbi:LysR family transcriptional regulator [Chromohalobacter sp. 296-RDG]|uniref:LysR family transcriptional regulator n=1 Tax=Chromohalobacter sp. 296-RDG TaxID=2994062 RepID=UPI0024698F57|nr:LysR family transcriptional regulator [Chromohalobacter sp. 296-RDG]
MLEQTHWTLLSALKDHGSITLAAAALNITQSAASQRLGEAERRLGVQLAIKRGRTLVLTEAGGTIANAARTATPLLQTAESNAIWQGKRNANRVRVAWSHFNPPGLASFLLRISRTISLDMDLEFIRIPSDRSTTPLNSDIADLMLGPGPVDGPNINSEVIFHDRLVAVVGGSSPLAEHRKVSPENFRNLNFLTYGLRPEPGWEYDQFFDRGKRFPTKLSRVESTELICHMLSDGEGISILPSCCVTLSSRAQDLVMLELESTSIAFDWSVSFLQSSEAENNLACKVAKKLSETSH